MTLLLAIVLLLGQKPLKNSDIENIGTRNINKGNLNYMSLEKEIEIGRELATEVERQEKLLDDAVVNEYVNRVGQKIVANSDVKIPVTIRVIDSDEVNAFALPGGYVYVNTGLIRTADSEAELASAIAHCVAHIAARHGTENASKGQLLNVASIPLMFYLDAPTALSFVQPLIFVGGPAGVGVKDRYSQRIVPMSFLSFVRQAVAEADYLGVQYLFKSGYDPAAAVSFLKRLQELKTGEPGTRSKLFETHPPLAERISATQKNIDLILASRPRPIAANPEFATIKARLVKN